MRESCRSPDSGHLVAERQQAIPVTGAKATPDDRAVPWLPGQIDRSDLSSPMPQFLADREPGLSVDLALLGRQFLGPRPPGCWCRPSREFLVADLSVLVSMAMDAVDACRCALVLEAPQLIDIALVGRNEAALAGQCSGLVEHLALIFVADRDLAGTTTLGPAGLEDQLVAPVCPYRLDLDRLCTAQAESSLQPQ